jgi:outer membrane receptor protein involved in Fe transport
LNSAWSALTTVPGVFVAPGQGGYVGAAPALSIRGGDYDQIGYEIDGVPVNRSFDNYPSGPTSSLGQQELQVYTGAAPANAEAQGLSGFINQVIRTGTYPAATTFTGDIGGPAYYHKSSFETSGSTSNRNFSYYIGLGGYNQDFRYIDQFQGSGVSQLYGNPLTPCRPTFGPALAPSCYTNGLYYGNSAAGSYVLGSQSLFTPNGTVADRDSVVNLHVGFPHKNGTKDDLQLLFVDNSINTQNYDSANDQGGIAYLTALGIGTHYVNGFQYNGPTGVTLPAGYKSSLVTYEFPRAVTNGAPNTVANPAPIPADVRDAASNNQGIFKAQFTHAIGPSALLKLYGYTYYSDWSVLSPNSLNSFVFGYPNDYELHAHTRGLSAQFTGQLGAKNLLNLQTSYTTSTTLRDNNTQFDNADREFATLVNSADPLAGICYTAAGAPAPCSAPSTYVTFAGAAAGLPSTVATCGAGKCEYLAVENGQRATFNTVRPKFSSAALTDQWKPTSNITLDAGLRFDRYEFDGSNTDTGPARTFFYNAYNLDNCVAAGGASIIPRAAPGGACPAGTTPADFTNPSGSVIEAYSEFQPRIGFTYALSPTTVLRGSYGRFAQAPNSAYQQYDTLQANAPAQLYGIYGFQKYGFTTPNHTVVPPTSDNLDFSFERQFGSDTAIKLSPFLRVTQNQIQNFDLNQQTAFISGLNVGNQTSRGIEFELDKGNFARDGVAAKLSLAYTNSYIKYSRLANGSSIIDPLNVQIKNYNAYTSFCAGHRASPNCAGGTTVSNVAAAPCYTTAGAPVTACSAADVANPYWNAPAQPLLDPNGNYPTFDTFPSGVGSAVAGYGAPYTATLLLQYKRSKLAVTPGLQFFAGQRYGAPATTLGVAPDSCTGILGSPATHDPRYNYGAPGGSGYNYADCTSILGFATTAAGAPTGGIPDPYTGKFDTIGAFAAPAQFLANLQLSYDVTPRLTIVTNLVNIVNTCFGGSKTAFTVGGTCGYGVLAGGATGAVGNTYNPGSPVQPYVALPYSPTWAGITPFGIFVSARAKI